MGMERSAGKVEKDGGEEEVGITQEEKVLTGRVRELDQRFGIRSAVDVATVLRVSEERALKIIDLVRLGR